MKIIFPITIFLLLFAASAFGQDPTDELNRLRQHLGVSPTTSVKLADAHAIPAAAATLKVYVAVGIDMVVKANFVRWFDDWNRKNGKKYGNVEVVTEITQADVIVARYTVLERATTKSDTYSNVVPGTVYNPATNSSVTRPVSRTFSVSYSMVPVFAYIMLAKPAGLEIISRYTDEASLSETKHSGESLRDDFFKLLKTDARRH